MRVVGGTHRGRRLIAPPGTTTRPTTDRVREALFSSLASLLGPDLGGGSVLDPFSGSGALGIEALSRGCERCTFVDRDRKALATARTNLSALGLDSQATVVSGDVLARGGRSLPGEPFALILLDPPYTLDAGSICELLEHLIERNALREGCTVSWEFGMPGPVWPSGFEVVRSKRYGDTIVEIAEWMGGESGS